MANENQDKDLGLTLGMLTLRIWLAMRAIQTGIEKFAGMGSTSKAVDIDGAGNAYGLTEAASVKSYALDNYQGVPGPLYDKFAGEPFIPNWGLDIYNVVLGPALLILGFALLIGVATRYTLFAMGLLYTSLTFGLILIKQDAGIAWLGIHILMIVAALALVKHNRFVVLKKW
jgi:thiosulfate dehydrogenase [quinone] large subunit